MRGFLDARGPDLASAIAFTALFSLVPLVASLAAFGSTLFGSERTGFFRLIHYTVPGATDDLIRRLYEASDRMRGILGVAALLFLIPTLRAYFLVEGAADAIWGTVQKRPFLKRLGLGVVVCIVAPALLGFGTSLILESGASFAEFRFLPLVVSALLLSLVYKAAINAHVQWSAALVAGAFAGSGLALLKWGFAAGVVALSDFNRVYGVLSSFIIFLVVIGIASTLFLFGVSLGHAFQFRVELLAHDEPERVEKKSSALNEAVRLLLRLARAREHGIPGVPLLALAEEVRRTEIEARARLERLVHAGLVVTSGDDDWRLSRSPDEISLYSVARAVGLAEPPVLPAGDDPMSETLRKVYRRTGREMRAVLQGTSLKDLRRQAPSVAESTGIFEQSRL